MVDKKSKPFLIFFILITIVSIALTFYRYIIVEDINYFTDEDGFKESLLEE